MANFSASQSESINKAFIRICVPICVRQASELQSALEHAAAWGDYIEIRLDYLTEDELKRVWPILPNLLAQSTRSVILTIRSLAQGGVREIASAEMQMFMQFAEQGLSKHDFVDLELDYLERHTYGKLDRRKIICSYHNFSELPTDLDAVFDRLAQTSAGVLKIAVRPERITDCISIFRLLERARRENRELIAIAMDEAGALTRVLAPSRGAFLTFGALNEDHSSAPGQITAHELRALYQIDSITHQTPITGLIGSPVAHSVSPHMHNAALHDCQLSGVYLPLEVTDLGDFMRRMVGPQTRELDWNLRGLSVTAPHKTEIIQYLDHIDVSAKEIGAVNTVTVKDERLLGSNTDAEAAIAPLRPLTTLRQAKVAVIGAGGAARAVLWQLGREGAASTLFVRNLQRGAETARAFGAACESLHDANFAGYDVVINTTPLGTIGKLSSESPVEAGALRGAGVAYDLVYNPLQTRFLREAEAANCKTLGGLEMLVLQAAEQFRLWNATAAPLDVMRNAALKRMAEARRF